MRIGRDSRLASLIASSAVVAFFLATPALAADCPELVGSLPGGWQTTDIAVSGDYAYLTGAGWLRVIDVSDPLAPVEVGYIDYGGGSVAVSGGYAYTGLYIPPIVPPGTPYSLMNVYDVSTPSAPVWNAHLTSPRFPPSDVAIISERFEYVALGFGLEVIDVTWPWMPFEICFLQTPDEAYGIAVEDGYAYVAGSDGLRVIDVTIPPFPVEAASLDTPDEAYGVAVEDGYAHVAGSGGLRVIDVNLPWGPFEVGSLGAPIPAWNVAVSRGYAYVAGGSPAQLRVIDVSDPSAPVEVGSYETGGNFDIDSRGIAVSDGYVFVGNDGVPLIVFRECPLYADGFESGDTSAWSATVP
jgi:hypothetical protein